jgi:hypothetical protein
VPFDDAPALQRAIEQALRTAWDADRLRDYAARNTWDLRVETLVGEFLSLHTVVAGEPAAQREATHA